MNMEIERIFLIENLDELRRKLMELGFKLRNTEVQYAEYVDFPDFRLFNTRQDFRFRYLYIEKDIRVFKHGEVSFAFREYPEVYSEVRDQINVFTQTPYIVDSFKNMLLKMGMIVSFTLWKDREEYSKTGKRKFREEIHIEIDSNIKMTQHPYHKKSHKLQDTLQLCKETEKEKSAPEIDELMEELGLTTEDVVTINYGERLNRMLGCDANPNIKI